MLPMAYASERVGVASASVPTTQSFDLYASSYPVIQQTLIHSRSTVMQCFAFDNLNGHIYIAQTTGLDSAGGSVQHAQQGDLTINKVSFAGQYLAWMKVEGCGHGFSMAVSNNADGSPEIWIEYGAEDIEYGEAYGRRITHTPFANSTIVSAADLGAHEHTVRPGSYHNSPSIDPTTNSIAIRYQPTLNALKKVVVFKLSDVLSSNYSAPLADITLPQSCYTGAQGFTIWGDHLYFLSGGAQTDCPGTNATSSSQLTKIDINTKTVVGPVNTYAFSTLGHREPEGMAIQIYNGSPRLAFGFAGWQFDPNNPNTCTTDRCVDIAYKDVLQ